MMIEDKNPASSISRLLIHGNNSNNSKKKKRVSTFVICKRNKVGKEIK